jgi:hypothetical protein
MTTIFDTRPVQRFREELLKMLAKRPTRIEKANGYHGPQLSDYAEKRARALIRGALEHFGTDLATLRRARKGDWRKGLLAATIQKETTMRLDWISEQLNMAIWGQSVHACRSDLFFSIHMTIRLALLSDFLGWLLPPAPT